MKNKEDKQEMIFKILSDTFIDISNISHETLIEFNIVNKLANLGFDVKTWLNLIGKDNSRICSIHNKKYDLYHFINTTFCYTLLGDNEKYRDLAAVYKDNYKKINLELIDKLIEYKEDKINITELAEYIKTMK